jgi:hypothetical protein
MEDVSYIKEFEKELEKQGYVECFGIGLWERNPELFV